MDAGGERPYRGRMRTILLLIVMLLTSAPACATGTPDDDASMAQCDEQAQAWCERAWSGLHGDWDIPAEIQSCRIWYRAECATGDALPDAAFDGCLDDIYSSASPNCIPLSCSSSWDTGPGHRRLSRACRI